MTVNAATSASNLVLILFLDRGRRPHRELMVSTWTAGTLPGTCKLMLGARAALKNQVYLTASGRPIDSTAGAVNWTAGTVAGSVSNTGTLAIAGAAIKSVGGTINEDWATACRIEPRLQRSARPSTAWPAPSSTSRP